MAANGGQSKLSLQGCNVVMPDGVPVARVEDGILRYSLPTGDSSIEFYNAVGGAHFHERSQVPLAMTTLDTPVYHGYLAKFRHEAEQGMVVDVGCGDGRNTWPWLEWGYKRIVAVDPVFAALARLRDRVAAHNPAWLDRLLLIEADARNLPLVSGCADRVLSIETLAYLNEEYGQGVAECARLLQPGGRMLVSDRDYEGGLAMQLLYFGGIKAMLRAAPNRDILDGNPKMLVRSRCFTEQEFLEEFRQQGLRVVSCCGISSLSLLISYLRSREALGEVSGADLEELGQLLARLGESGAMRRSHVVVAEK